MKLPLAMIWAEGFLDRIAAERLAEFLHLRIEGAVKDAGGIDEFWKHINKYNDAAKQIGLVFALADHDGVGCVGPKLARKVPRKHKNLVLRLSVAELESWLLADHRQLSTYLSAPVARFPEAPDTLRDPKRSLVDLARLSSKPAIRQGMVPRDGYSSVQGPEYTLIMERFIRKKWQPLDAAKRSPSLRRAIEALQKAAAGRGV